MALKAITFNNKNVTARDHGTLFNELITDGVLSGCAVTTSGANISVAQGYILAHGRLIENTSALTVAVTDESGYTRLKLTCNTDGTLSTSTQNASSLEGLPALTQDDINDGTHSTYEIELAVVVVSNYAITSIARSIGSATCQDDFVSTREAVANKVTSVTSSSTDTQYPSAKLVYDQLATKQATLDADQIRKITISSSSPSGGSDGDIWFLYS